MSLLKGINSATHATFEDTRLQQQCFPNPAKRYQGIVRENNAFLTDRAEFLLSLHRMNVPQARQLEIRVVDGKGFKTRIPISQYLFFERLKVQNFRSRSVHGHSSNFDLVVYGPARFVILYSVRLRASRVESKYTLSLVFLGHHA